MTDHGQLSEVHVLAKALRVPLFANPNPDEPPPSAMDKASALEDYMLLSAYYHGELCEERLTEQIAVRPDEVEWRDLVGWEPMRRGKTVSSIDDAKAMLRPELWARIDDARWRIARLTEQIDRLDRDATKASRAYTMLTAT